MSYLTPTWPAPKHIHAHTTTRTHFGESDVKSPAESAKLQTLLHLPSQPLWLKQTHSTIALPATPATAGQSADAIYTDQANQVCAVLTADCLPILLCNPAGTEVAAIHAGWRGLANGIIGNTLDAMNQTDEHLLVWLGPAIGPTKFEVGADVYDAFVGTRPEAAKAFTPIAPNKWLANLYALAKMQFHERGITSIYGGDHCTYTQDELFYSYRRDNGLTGRMVSIIWISPKT